MNFYVHVIHLYDAQMRYAS